jgi:hypothetical protein
VFTKSFTLAALVLLIVPFGRLKISILNDELDEHMFDVLLAISRLYIFNGFAANKWGCSIILELNCPFFWKDECIWLNVLPFHGISGIGFRFNKADIIILYTYRIIICKKP